jgi:hypothetical protein
LQRTRYDHVLTFEIELRFDEEVNPTSDKLLDTIPDVLFAADQKHHLLPGYPLPTGGERLIGSSVSFKAVAREPNLVPTTNFVPPPHWEEGDAVRSELLSPYTNAPSVKSVRVTAIATMPPLANRRSQHRLIFARCWESPHESAFRRTAGGRVRLRRV